MDEITNTKDLRDFIEFTTGQEAEAEQETPAIPADWDMYITEFDGEKALVLLDLSLAHVAPIFRYNYLLGVQVAINDPTEDGFYTDEEQPALFELEDRVTEVFATEGQCRFVAAVTTGGTRIMYFYSKDEAFLAGLVGKCAAEYPNYQFNYLIEQDTHWNFYYDVLYPGEMDLQLMRNRRIVDELQRAGFDLDEPREICHWFFFDNGATRRQCAVRLMAKGFDIVDDNFYEETIEAYPFGLKAACRQTLDLEVLLAKTYECYEILADFDGIYDGWDVLDDDGQEA